MISMIDTHCHLFDEAFDNDREELIKNITLSGVSKLIIVGFSDDTNLKAYELSSKYDFMYPTSVSYTHLTLPTIRLV